MLILKAGNEFHIRAKDRYSPIDGGTTVLMSHLEPGEALSSKKLRYLYAAALLYLAVHLLITQISAYDYLSGFMVVGLGLLKIACCLWWFIRLSKSPARFRWLALACGTLFANASAQIYTWRYVFFTSFDYLSGTASLLTSLACIPVLISITSNFNRKDPPSVRWIDLAIGLTLGTLFTVQFLFPAHPQSLSADASILSVNRLIDFENTFLLICGVLQFLSADNAEDRRFAYLFFSYIAIGVPLLAIRNRYAMHYPTPIWDLALDVSPLVLILLSLNPIPAWARSFRASDQLVYLVRGGSPLFISLALTLLGIGVSTSHFYVGITGILLGIIGYGLRNAIIHGKLLKTEDSLVIATQELEVQASRDGLTGIPNRRLFDQTLHREWRVATQTGNPFAVLMLDVDSFKGFNDAYGHQKGDECLIAVAKTVQELLLRAGDFVARYGGEEFAVILPGASIPVAMAIGERLRAGVAELSIPNTSSAHNYVSISVGAATSDTPGVTDMTSLLRAADQALYRAKNTGRNRVETIDASP
jgi:diguanylate cyclase (GGDEF)-like protein